MGLWDRKFRFCETKVTFQGGITMAKIRKNLSDREMFGATEENLTFENMGDEEETTSKIQKTAKKQDKVLDEGYLSRQAADHLNKALLEFKVSMFQKGILDYDFKISREENRIVLTAVPQKKPRT